jgi:hypothetical protein
MIPAPQQWPFLHIFSLFSANQWKFLTMNHLHAKPSFSSQTQSSLVKPFFTLTMNSHPNQAPWLPPASHANGGGECCSRQPPHQLALLNGRGIEIMVGIMAGCGIGWAA